MPPNRSASPGKIVAQPALQKYSPVEYLPGPVRDDDEAALMKAAGEAGTTIFHPVGTAKMGRDGDPMAVVDARLRVTGMENLVAFMLRDAVDHIRQYQLADNHDCGKRRGMIS